MRCARYFFRICNTYMYCRPSNGLGDLLKSCCAKSRSRSRSRPMGLVFCLGWCVSDESNDEDGSVSAVFVLFLVFCCGLNDRSLISSNAQKVWSSRPPTVVRLIILLSGEQSVMSERNKALMPELQDALRGCLALVAEAFMLVSLPLPGLSNDPRDDNPLKEKDRRWVLDGDVADE